MCWGVCAQPGFWASDASDGSAFYKCPLAAACLGGTNGTRSVCAQGYTGTLCAVCQPGYYPKYGLCQQCPSSRSPETVVASFGLPLLLLCIFGTLFVLRSMASRGMMKVGISMLQIIAR